MNRRTPPNPSEHVKASQEAGQLTPELVKWIVGFCRASSPKPLHYDDAIQELTILTIRYLDKLKPDDYNMVGWFRTALHSIWALELRKVRRARNTRNRLVNETIDTFPVYERATLRAAVTAHLQQERIF